MHRYISIILLMLFSISATALGADDTGSDRKKKADKVVINLSEPDPDVPMYADAPLLRPKQVQEFMLGTERRTIYVNPEYNSREGIDVSHYQGNIDWQALADSKSISFAFVKACESTGFVDRYYDYNMAEGKRCGLAMGSYHFWRAHVDQDAQFQHMAQIIKRETCDIIPIIDVEAANGVGVETLAQRLHYFLDLCEAYYGVKPIIYTYVSFYNKYLYQQQFDEYPLFMAYYGSNPPSVRDWRDYCMWQYTDKGHLPGIGRGYDKYVDRSCFMGNHTLNEIAYNPDYSIINNPAAILARHKYTPKITPVQSPADTISVKADDEGIKYRAN